VFKKESLGEKRDICKTRNETLFLSEGRIKSKPHQSLNKKRGKSTNQLVKLLRGTFVVIVVSPKKE